MLRREEDKDSDLHPDRHFVYQILIAAVWAKTTGPIEIHRAAPGCKSSLGWVQSTPLQKDLGTPVRRQTFKTKPVAPGALAGSALPVLQG